MSTFYSFKYFDQSGGLFNAKCVCDDNATGALPVSDYVNISLANSDETLCMTLGGNSTSGYTYTTTGAGAYPDPCSNSTVRQQGIPLTCNECPAPLYPWTQSTVNYRACIKLYCQTARPHIPRGSRIPFVHSWIRRHHQMPPPYLPTSAPTTDTLEEEVEVTPDREVFLMSQRLLATPSSTTTSTASSWSLSMTVLLCLSLVVMGIVFSQVFHRRSSFYYVPLDNIRDEAEKSRYT